MRNLLIRLLVTPTTVLPGGERMGYDVNWVFVPKGRKLMYDGDISGFRFVDRTPKIAV